MKGSSLHSCCLNVLFGLFLLPAASWLNSQHVASRSCIVIMELLAKHYEPAVSPLQYHSSAVCLTHLLLFLWICWLVYASTFSSFNCSKTAHIVGSNFNLDFSHHLQCLFCFKQSVSHILMSHYFCPVLFHCKPLLCPFVAPCTALICSSQYAQLHILFTFQLIPALFITYDRIVIIHGLTVNHKLWWTVREAALRSMSQSDDQCCCL